MSTDGINGRLSMVGDDPVVYNHIDQIVLIGEKVVAYGADGRIVLIGEEIPLYQERGSSLPLTAYLKKCLVKLLKQNMQSFLLLTIIESQVIIFFLISS